MKLNSLKTLVLAIEKGSIVQAAKHLNITKAAASRQIIQLENDLNTQLLYRSTRCLQLTDVGQLFYQSAKNVLAAVAEAKSTVTYIQENPVGKLRIASHRHIGEKYIVNNLKEFTSMYPDLIIDLELGDRFPDLEKENIDILFGIENEGPDHLVRKKIATIQRILCATPEYLKQFGTPTSPEDLRNHRFITHSFRNPDNLLLFKNDKKIYLNYFLRLNDAQAMLNCCLQSLGIIRIHNYYIQKLITDGELIEILKNQRESEKSMYIFYQQQKYTQPKIRLFLDFIYKKLSIDPINPNDQKVF